MFIFMGENGMGETPCSCGVQQHLPWFRGHPVDARHPGLAQHQRDGEEPLAQGGGTGMDEDGGIFFNDLLLLNAGNGWEWGLLG